MHGTVVAVSGPVDHLTDGDRVVRVANGHLLLTRVTGVGCTLGALMAGFAAVVDDSLVAAVAATATLTVCADAAAAGVRGPGSSAIAVLRTQRGSWLEAVTDAKDWLTAAIAAAQVLDVGPGPVHHFHQLWSPGTAP